MKRMKRAPVTLRPQELGKESYSNTALERSYSRPLHYTHVALRTPIIFSVSSVTSQHFPGKIRKCQPSTPVHSHWLSNQLRAFACRASSWFSNLGLTGKGMKHPEQRQGPLSLGHSWKLAVGVYTEREGLKAMFTRTMEFECTSIPLSGCCVDRSSIFGHS